MFGKGLWIISSGREEVPDSYDANTENGYTSTPTTYTISSVADTDAFCKRFQRKYGYKDSEATLHIGDKVQINDGTYNVDWYVAGFDVEHNRTAIDGTAYDNGYGIALIPTTVIGKSKWNTTETIDGAYMSSFMHTSVLPGIITLLKTVLGDHIVNRNVLLSNSIGPRSTSGSGSRYYVSSSYQWTTAYATLMSYYQILNKASSYKYDDGEANYHLPLFKSIKYYNGTVNSDYWIRTCTYKITDWPCAVEIGYAGMIASANVTGTSGVRPLIYIR